MTSLLGSDVLRMRCDVYSDSGLPASKQILQNGLDIASLLFLTILDIFVWCVVVNDLNLCLPNLCLESGSIFKGNSSFPLEPILKDVMQTIK